MVATTPLVWFITGCSTGFGAAIATQVLKSGHKVIATARNLATASKDNPEIAALGGHWITLDVNSPVSGSVLEEATKIFGRIDVLVNNAAYSVLGALEDITEEEIQAQFATNFFGPHRLIRSILPIFRAQNSGTIVNISSIAGLDGLPSSGAYAASKFALEGTWFSESLAREVSAFNIRVLLVEPGAFRTRFLASSVKTKGAMSSAYVGTPVENTLKSFDNLDGAQRGDPDKAASRIFDVVTKTGVAAGLEKEYLRLPLGDDSLERLGRKIESLQETVEALRSISSGTDL